jgi:hypothetical protein
MPGSFVRDATQVDLLSGVTLTTAAGANQTGTAHEIGWPGLTQFVLTTAGKSGTTPTITVDIQGSEKSDFSDDVVTLATISGVDETNGQTLEAVVDVDSRYVRAISTVAGTSGVYTGSTLIPVPARDRRQRSATPSVKKLV